MPPPPRLARKLPEILAVIEHVGRLHVVGLVEPRLNQEEVLRITNVPLQVRPHGANGLNKLGKMRWKVAATGSAVSIR